MALWKRGRRYWTQTMINGVRIRQPLCPAGLTRATTKWQEAVQLEKDVIKAALAGHLSTQAAPKKFLEACDKYLTSKEATANTTRAVEFDRERLELVKRYLGDISLASITRNNRNVPGQAPGRWREQPDRQHGRGGTASGPKAIQALAST